MLSYEDIVLYRSLGDALAHKHVQATLKSRTGNSWLSNLISSVTGAPKVVHNACVTLKLTLSAAAARSGAGPELDAVAGAVHGHRLLGDRCTGRRPAQGGAIDRCDRPPSSLIHL